MSAAEAADDAEGPGRPEEAPQAPQAEGPEAAEARPLAMREFIPRYRSDGELADAILRKIAEHARAWDVDQPWVAVDARRVSLDVEERNYLRRIRPSIHRPSAW